MPPERSRSPGRLLAPLALLVVALALVVVLGSALAGSDEAPPSSAPADQTRGDSRADRPQGTDTEARPRSRGGSATYTVEAGDTPGAIADEVGLTIDRLLELNPELDPNALVAGQKLKLK